MGVINDILFSSKVNDLAAKAMDAQGKRTMLITSNLANAETPGYKSVDVKPFEAALAEAYKPKTPMLTTNPLHMAGTNNLEHFQPEVLKSGAPGRLDGNNVNLDDELNKMNEVSLQYQTTITAYKRRGQIINAAIDMIR